MKNSDILMEQKLIIVERSSEDLKQDMLLTALEELATLMVVEEVVMVLLAAVEKLVAMVEMVDQVILMVH